MNTLTDGKQACGYAPVNGLNRYYEIEGTGTPLVYIPPAFACSGMNSFPALVRNHSVITVDLQGHGRTGDIPDRPLTIGQHASDVVGLLRHLGIAKADFFGESYGGAVAVWIALHFPEFAGRIATYGATFGPPQIAVDSKMLQLSTPPTPESKSLQFQRNHYKRVAPAPEYWPRIWDKVCSMRWEGFSKDELVSIQAPVLIALGDHDFVRLEHAVETFRRIPGAELAVIPDAGHFALFSEPDKVMPVIAAFLGKSEASLPIATGETGYRPGETR